jgi:H+/Cl- antiporter ClcA
MDDVKGRIVTPKAFAPARRDLIKMGIGAGLTAALRPPAASAHVLTRASSD